VHPPDAIERVVVALVLRGEADWVPMAYAWAAARDIGGAATDDEARATAIEAIAIAIDRGWMTVGDVTENGFVPWPIGGESAVIRLEHDWLPSAPSPELGEVGWLSNTTRGDVVARSIASEQQSPHHVTRPRVDHPGAP